MRLHGWAGKHEGMLEMAGALTEKQKVGRGDSRVVRAVGNSWATLFMSSSKVSIQMPGNDIAPGLLRSDPLYIIHV